MAGSGVLRKHRESHSAIAAGHIPGEALIDLSAGRGERLGVACEVLAAESEPAFAFNFARWQYSSREILASLMEYGVLSNESILGVTAVDLYIPILTFVFGEGNCKDRAPWSPFTACARSFMACPRIPRF
jgi:hypothetical protein